MPLVTGAYDFNSNILSIIGPGVIGASVVGGPDTAAAEEGFSIEYTDDQNVATGGADGSVMMSMMATRKARVTVRLQKTAPSNQVLNAMFRAQHGNPQNWGVNVMTHRDIWRGDSNTMQQVAFARHPNIVYAARGNTNEWVFDVGIWDAMLGSGTIAIV